jgi:hypothetical protein
MKLMVEVLSFSLTLFQAASHLLYPFLLFLEPPPAQTPFPLAFTVTQPKQGHFSCCLSFFSLLVLPESALV